LKKTHILAILKGKGGETAAEAAEQRILNAQASTANIAAEVKNALLASVRKFAQTHDV
jgi:hypothetical protein